MLLQSMEQPTRLAATRVPVLQYYVLPRINPAVTAIMALLAFGKDFVAQITEYRRDADAEMVGDGVTGPALAMQRPDLLVPSPTPLPALARERSRFGLRLGGWHDDRHRRFCLMDLRNSAEIAGMSGESYLQDLGQILQQVKAVGHLYGLGCAVSGTLGIGPGAVACDHLDAGVRAQPSG